MPYSSVVRGRLTLPTPTPSHLTLSSHINKHTLISRIPHGDHHRASLGPIFLNQTLQWGGGGEWGRGLESEGQSLVVVDADPRHTGNKPRRCLCSPGVRQLRGEWSPCRGTQLPHTRVLTDQVLKAALAVRAGAREAGPAGRPAGGDLLAVSLARLSPARTVIASGGVWPRF